MEKRSIRPTLLYFAQRVAELNLRFGAEPPCYKQGEYKNLIEEIEVLLEIFLDQVAEGEYYLDGLTVGECEDFTIVLTSSHLEENLRARLGHLLFGADERRKNFGA